MIYAMIPMRSGSKGIPNKNIRELNGIPLCFYSINAALNSKADYVVINTDSSDYIDFIKNNIDKYCSVDENINKKLIYFIRDPDLGQDTTTTEGVMLDCIEKLTLDDNDTFILIQATNPFITTTDINNCINLYGVNKRSVLSAVKFDRFIWKKSNNNFTSFNYDYMNRKRRQDVMEKYYIENGAIYINKVFNVTKFQNRLDDSPIIYEMNFISQFEIDTEEDWNFCELLIKNKIILN